MQEHRRILRLAARGSLPDEIDSDSELSVEVVRELVEAGHLKAIDATSFDHPAFVSPRITLAGREYLLELELAEGASESELLGDLDRMRDIMVAVSTGGPRIDDVNSEYRDLYQSVNERLLELGVPTPLEFPDLWDWYGRWSGGDLPSYQSRRQFLSEHFGRVRSLVADQAAGRAPRDRVPTGWLKVDRALGEIRRRLAQAETEEQYQAVGLLCRETLISLAQAVYNPEKHHTSDGVVPSTTDAKRMLEAFIAAELSGRSNEALRKHARAAIDLANDLQHRRTAGFRSAALCVEATGSAVNVVAIISGRRDPNTV